MAHLPTRLISAATLFLAASAARADDCETARARYEETGVRPAAKRTLLEEAVRLCPRFALALNDLGVVYEDDARFREAEALYRRAIAADPALPEPYAGLGDALAKAGDLPAAAEAYQCFLDRLDPLRRDGDPRGVLRHEAEYRTRLARALDGTPIVDAAAIVRALRPKGVGVRQKLSEKEPVDPYRAIPKIDLTIHFELGSDEQRPASEAQIREVAKALRAPDLAKTPIRIDGHTDSTGSHDFNLDLSRRRAARVRDTIVSDGVSASRLEIDGFGFTRPIADNSTVEGRARNRRVTIVNLGGAR